MEESKPETKNQDVPDVADKEKSTRGESSGEGGFRRYVNPEAPKPFPAEIPAELIPPTAVDITAKGDLERGRLYKLLLENGDPALAQVRPRFGNLVKVHYQCWVLTDPEKKLVDSSRFYPEDTEPLQFNIGSGEVIRALNVGVRTMRTGEKAMLIAHYDYGFGRKSQYRQETSNIPNCSFICAEVELVEIDDGSKGLSSYESEDVTREMLYVAERETTLPLTSSSLMFVKLQGYKVTGQKENSGAGVEEENNEIREIFLKETVFPFTPYFNSWGFTATDVNQYPIPLTLGELLKPMRKGDIACFKLEGKAAFWEEMVVNGVTIKKGEPVNFLVTIDDVDEIYDPYLLSLKQKVEISEQLIETGKKYESSGSHEAALSKYHRVQEYLTDATCFLKKVPVDLGNQCNEMLFFALAKLAELSWEWQHDEKVALEYCNRALEVQQNASDVVANVYWIRGKIYNGRHEYELARADFETVCQLMQKKAGKESELNASGAALKNVSTLLIEVAIEECREEMKRMYVDATESLEKIKCKKIEEKTRICLKYVPPK